MKPDSALTAASSAHLGARYKLPAVPIRDRRYRWIDGNFIPSELRSVDERSRKRRLPSSRPDRLFGICEPEIAQ